MNVGNGKTIKFTSDEIIDINNRINNKESLRSISRYYNTTHSTIIRALKDGRL
jgi:IS30 family transposase